MVKGKTSAFKSDVNLSTPCIYSYYLCAFNVSLHYFSDTNANACTAFRLNNITECENMGSPTCDPSSCYQTFSEMRCDESVSSNQFIDVICTSPCHGKAQSPKQRGFQCDSGEVILREQFCDGFLDCSDGSDELQAIQGFRCRGKKSGISCILPRFNLFDDVAHCSDGYDLCNNRQSYQCLTEPTIISRSQVCDGEANCFDGSDEFNEDEQKKGFACPSNDSYFICNDGQKLISIYQVCDGRFDCFDRSDECDYEVQLNQEAIELRCVDIDQCRSIFSSETDMIANTGLKVSFWVVAFVVVVGNFFVILYTLKNLQDSAISFMRKCQQLIVLNIAISDFLMAIYLLIISSNNIALSGNYNFETDKYWRYGLLCHIAGLFAAVSSESSCFLMVLLTAFRLRSISNPFISATTTSDARWKILIGLAWALSFILGFVPFVWFFLFTGAVSDDKVDEFDNYLSSLSRNDSVQVIENIPFYYSATSVCLPRFYSDKTSRTWLYTLLIITINFLCFVFIAIAYGFIYKKSSHRPIKNDQTDQQNNKLQKRIARIILSDCACWIPICIMSYLSLAGVYLSDLAYVITAGLLLPVNSALNPFLYSSLPDKILAKISTKMHIGRGQNQADIISDSGGS